MTAPHRAPRASNYDDAVARRRGAIWPVLIVGLLGLNVAVCAITVTVAVTNPIRVQPQYYERSIGFTAEDLAWPQPERHGWTLRLDRTGSAPVIVVRDRVDRPVSLAQVEVRVAGGDGAWLSLGAAPDGRARLGDASEAVEIRVRSDAGLAARAIRGGSGAP